MNDKLKHLITQFNSEVEEAPELSEEDKQEILINASTEGK